jgi:hypothetical protein
MYQFVTCAKAAKKQASKRLASDEFQELIAKALTLSFRATAQVGKKHPLCDLISHALLLSAATRSFTELVGQE